MQNLQLALSEPHVAQFFANPNQDSASILATLISRQPTTDTLDSILEVTIDRLLLLSSAQPSQIDSLLSHLALLASTLPPFLSHPGQPIGLRHYTFARLRHAAGPDVLAERFSYSLHHAIWDYISRAVTPNNESDKTKPKRYYITASVHATLLARAFATQPLFRPRLWREVEDVLVKGLYSAGRNPEPGVYLAMAALFVGAGHHIRHYLSQEDGIVGRGKDWLWWDDVRIQPDECWNWQDIVDQLKKHPDPEFFGWLPKYVRKSLEIAKVHVGDGDGELTDWNSDKIATELFSWAQGA